MALTDTGVKNAKSRERPYKHASVVEEQTEFLKSDLSYTQQAVLRVGAVFRWSIGYDKSPSGNRRTSQLVFRQLPKWSQIDINEARALGRSLNQQLSEERVEDSSQA